GVQPEILPQQDRHSLPVAFEVRDHVRQLVKIDRQDAFHVRQRNKRNPRLHLRTELLVVVARLQELNHQAARSRAMAVAYAERSDKSRESRVPAEQLADALPQKQQRRKTSLILCSHKRSPEFERRPDPAQKRLVIFKQRRGVQTVLTQLLEDLRSSPDPICTHDLVPVFIPDKQMYVVCIEFVQIAALA